jgi:hypothetical protein
MPWLNWIARHWDGILANAGIVGLLFTGVSLHRDARERRVQNLLRFTEQHRDLWQTILAKPELSRLLDRNADLDSAPLTPEEARYTGFLILHLNSAHRAIRAGLLDEPEGMSEDIRQFFARPVPAAVWKNTRASYDRKFVAFIDVVLKGTNERRPI